MKAATPVPVNTTKRMSGFDLASSNASTRTDGRGQRVARLRAVEDNRQAAIGP